MDVTERLETALPTIAAHADRTDSDARFPREPISALADAGLLGLTLPAESGGLGATPGEFVDVLDGVAGVCASTAMVQLMHLTAGATLAAVPADSSYDVLPELASGRRLATLAFSEKGSRSHFWAPVSRAETDGTGKIRIRSDKSWVTSAHEADVYVASTLSPGGTGPTESDLFLVERNLPGVEVLGPFDGVGLRGNDSAPVRLDVEVHVSDRLGAEGSGFTTMMQTVLPWFSLGNSAVSLGCAGAALDAVTAHVSGARFEHTGSTLGDLPTVRAYLAKAWADLAAHRALLAETARKVAQPDEGTVLHVLATKAACNECALRVTETALRLGGGAAYSKQVGIDRPYRDARAGFVMAPTSDVLFDFVGRALCGMDLF